MLVGEGPVIDGSRSSVGATRTRSSASARVFLTTLEFTRTRRVRHVDDLLADRAAGLLAGMVVLPKKSALADYSYRLSHDHQRAIVAALATMKLTAESASAARSVVTMTASVELPASGSALRACQCWARTQKRWRRTMGLGEHGGCSTAARAVRAPLRLPVANA